MVKKKKPSIDVSVLESQNQKGMGGGGCWGWGPLRAALRLIRAASCVRWRPGEPSLR